MKEIFKNSSDKIIIHFAKGDIRADVANSFLRRTTGLSFRSSLSEKTGLLFIFPVAIRPIFWNFGMRFPIDVIWINNEKIVDIEKNIPRMANGLKIFYPSVKVDAVLEIPAGSADIVGAKIGDVINLVYEKK